MLGVGCPSVGLEGASAGEAAGIGGVMVATGVMVAIGGTAGGAVGAVGRLGRKG